MAARLSQNKRVEGDAVMPKSLSNCCSQIISLVVMAKARYSAAEERDVVVCLLAFHETKESPRNMQKPEMDFLE